MVEQQHNHRGSHRRRSRIRTLRKDTPTHRSGQGSGVHVKITHRDKTPRRVPKPKRRPPKQSGTGRPRGPKSGLAIPPPGDNLRIIPLGGFEEIGKNMTAIEYKEDIVVIDAGFQFSEVETPGIDYIIPDVTYLEERKGKIRGIFITHGHYDHIGAIPHIMERIGNPPVYSREFGALVMQRRQVEYTSAPPLDVRIVDGTQRVKAGTHMHVRFFEIEHAIRDAMGIIVETPVGNVVIITDVRVNNIDGVPTKEEMEHYAFFKNEKVLLFMLDSTRIEKPGFSTSEQEAIEGVAKYVKSAPGRIIIGMFSSQVERFMEIIKYADSIGKKVIIDGRSMRGNAAILEQLGLMTTKNLIPIEAMRDYPPNKIVIIATGAQGEEYSAFDRMSTNRHKYIKLHPTDTVVLSSSIIPGNEMAIQKLKDNLYRSEARIISYLEDKVHAGGHGYRGELEWIHKQINYRFFMPMHGHHYMLRIHAEAAQELGVPKENIVISDNGSIVEITPDGKRISMRKEKAPADPVMVDGFSVSGQQEVVIRDRQLLAEDGIMVIVASVDPRSGKLRKSPDIIARGFVYVRESQQLFDETRAIVKRTVENTVKGMHPINFDIVKGAVTDEVRRHLFQRTAKSPMVIPVIIGV
ncbi:ribonuclease J [Candidatus Wolfebacteria bacterium]|nr:ribonuclease J [Candidatus Wolfebacteria bacterium]